MLRAAFFARAACTALFFAAAPFHQQAAAQDYAGGRGYGPIHKGAPGWRTQRIGWRGDNPLARLGEKLFFDTRLSASGTTACASCHNPNFAYADPRRVSVSDNGKHGRRNAPPLLDVGFFSKLMWDGSFHTLEQQAFGPFQRGEMGIGVDQAVQRLHSDPQYMDLFRAALGTWPTPDGMATYQRTLVPRASRVDRFLASNDAGTLSPIERNGYEVFTRRAGCDRCHHPVPARGDGRPLFSDFQFHNLGIGYRSGGEPDAGRYELSRNPADVGAFRTPSLRHSAKTPPYMHDGSLATLEEVVEFYSAGGVPNPHLSPLIRPLHLGSYEKAALVAFLRALGE
jgi:cytochrome c peroxidase